MKLKWSVKLATSLDIDGTPVDLTDPGVQADQEAGYSHGWRTAMKQIEHMTLDDAIDHAAERGRQNGQCGDQHRQLAEWLRELRDRRMYCDGDTCTRPV